MDYRTTPTDSLEHPNVAATFSTWHAREDLRAMLRDLADITDESALCAADNDLREIARLVTTCTVAVQMRAAQIAGIEQLTLPVAV